MTYREMALLVSNSSSTLDRRYVAVVIAHELAHQVCWDPFPPCIDI